MSTERGEERQFVTTLNAYFRSGTFSPLSFRFFRFGSFGLAESPRIDYLGFEELLDSGEIVVPRVCLGGSCGVWGAS